MSIGVIPLFGELYGIPSCRIQNLLAGKCCVLKAAAQRVILNGEHAKVALDFYLCL